MRDRIKDAYICKGEFRELATESPCGRDTCVGGLRLRLATSDVTIHLSEAERVALIQALGGIDTLGPA